MWCAGAPALVSPLLQRYFFSPLHCPGRLTLYTKWEDQLRSSRRTRSHLLYRQTAPTCPLQLAGHREHCVRYVCPLDFLRTSHANASTPPVHWWLSSTHPRSLPGDRRVRAFSFPPPGFAFVTCDSAQRASALQLHSIAIPAGDVPTSFCKCQGVCHAGVHYYSWGCALERGI